MRVNETPSFPNNSALGRGIRVTMSAGYLVAASDTQDELGTLVDAVLAGDAYAAVVPPFSGGVVEMVASGAINQYAKVFAAASGKISATGTLRRGVALDAASGDGSIIRVLKQGGSGSPL